MLTLYIAKTFILILICNKHFSDCNENGLNCDRIAIFIQRRDIYNRRYFPGILDRNYRE